jgi:hypothetical protein
MNTEHHFIVKYVSGMGWLWDIASEEARFPDGTVWTGDSWVESDISEEINRADREVCEQLMRSIDVMNGDF